MVKNKNKSIISRDNNADIVRFSFNFWIKNTFVYIFIVLWLGKFQIIYLFLSFYTREIHQGHKILTIFFSGNHYILWINSWFIVIT